MIEKKILDAVEPLLDEIVALEKRLESLQLQKGEDGKDGANGADGVSPDPVAVAEVLMEEHAELLKGLAGSDGKDADPEAVASVIIEKHLDLIKGADGADGANGLDGISPEPSVIVEMLIDKHFDDIKGADGKDADPVNIDEVKKSVMDDEDFNASMSNTFKSFFQAQQEAAMEEVLSILK